MVEFSLSLRTSILAVRQRRRFCTAHAMRDAVSCIAPWECLRSGTKAETALSAKAVALVIARTRDVVVAPHNPNMIPYTEQLAKVNAIVMDQHEQRLHSCMRWSAVKQIVCKGASAARRNIESQLWNAVVAKLPSLADQAKRPDAYVHEEAVPTVAARCKGALAVAGVRARLVHVFCPHMVLQGRRSGGQKATQALRPASLSDRVRCGRRVQPSRLRSVRGSNPMVSKCRHYAWCANLCESKTHARFGRQ